MKTAQIIVGAIEERYTSALPQLVQLACRFSSQVYIGDGQKRLNAKSIMGMMVFHPGEGDQVLVEANGSDEKEALEAIMNFLQCR